MSDYEQARELARRARGVYERLGAGPRSILRRCRTGDEVREEGWFWRLFHEVEARPDDARWLARLVACFPSAAHREADGFDLGGHMRKRVYGEVVWKDLPKRAIAFRRLLAARDPDDLAHHLQRVLMRAGQPKDKGAAVDWGVVGADLKFFGGSVRRRWASGFYTGSVDQDGAEGESA